ncbi:MULTISPECIES: hypothetical protein [unclassified Streptomyces]|uniref:hypothetical protein n=1 Tax=unclassified Streptomyces TaxID=2593676 RepID=UPI00115FFBF5|nr:MULTISPECIES: hypothetical protein [unclassified Streptomyces]
MKNFGRMLVTAVCTATLCAGLPSSAQAVQGTFVYRVAGYGHVLNAPQDGRCYNTPGTANEPTNHTDRVAVLHRGTDCRAEEVVEFLDPAHQAPTHFRSVLFISR